ncbi:hypothetical protein CVT25_007717 [Psilocybe cyanescens]|uniref:Amino acid transporter transmembrane domain-containing protein n=1 Tax=Psilocybe cyanescens TaxID=93625 RepID=A0A409XPF8_PSICY|nr:hypothetical protein CVT25_007717 [Psilocybe cyanescens]
MPLPNEEYASEKGTMRSRRSTSSTRSPDDSIDFRDDGSIPEHRQIGLFSAVFFIFNRIIGTGIFATPSSILTYMWLICAVIAAAGMQVYIVWGSIGCSLKWRQLEYLFCKFEFLMISVFSANAVLLAGEYVLLVANVDPTHWTCRLVGFTCITFSVLFHGTALKCGLRLQNFLLIFKILVLVFIIITGFVALSGRMKIEKPNTFTNAFEGPTAGASSVCLSLYNQVSYAIVEVKNPQRVARIAGPLAIGVVTILYVLANVAYFAGATKEEVTTSGWLVAALLFKNVYGEKAQRALSVSVALSALGNVSSVSFSRGRVNQELGREGILPFSRIWGSNKPFNAPLAGLALHKLFCIIVIFALPPGDAYDFVLNVLRTLSLPSSLTHPYLPLIYLAFRPYPDWPLSSLPSLIAPIFFGGMNVFLFIVPLIRPPVTAERYVSLPYWTHAVVGWAVFGLGLLYYVVWAKLAPWVGGYSLVRVEQVGKDGLRRHVFRTVGKDKSA